MANIREWLEEAEKFYGEPIEAIVVGTYEGSPYNHKAQADENIVLSREDGLRKLDRDYENGYGGADCNPMYAWTKTRIFLVHEYDGATGPVWIPRNPMALEPTFGGNSIAIDMSRKRQVAV